MIEVKKEDIYYYIYNTKGEFEWAKLRSNRDQESHHGLSISFEVLDSSENHSGQISANQLNGVGVWGFSPFISKDKHVNIKRIFEGNNV